MIGESRILVVDDHELNLKLLERVLELEEYEVIPVGSIAGAERALAERRPDLIVLDLQLPDGDGLQFARRVKSAGAAAPSILACTASAMIGDEERALAAGCDAYVAKPIDTREFAATVAVMLAAARHSTTSG